MDVLRVTIADDSEFMRLALKRILETQECLEIVGMASDGEEAVNQVRELKPDVAILDIKMPKISGIEAAHQIVADNPGTGILILSAYEETQYFSELLKSGATGKGYLLKTSLAEVDALIRVIEAVAQGDTVLDPVIAQRMAEAASDQSEPDQEAQRTGLNFPAPFPHRHVAGPLNKPTP